MKTFKKKSYKIAKDQFISDIEPFKSLGIPANVIFFKILPGCGATSREITFPRHSIIVEPNVPVIIGKCVDKNLLGVYEGTTIEDIRAYLANDVQYKKLLVTPESFYKIKEAVEGSTFDLYNDFFLLFDECEKVIQDVSFRGKIILPLDDFFLFTNKAFVSATPIIPTDPRFEENGFVVIELVPDYDYSQEISLRITNNVFTSLWKVIIDNVRDQYFIFFNTTDNIADFIKRQKIKEEAMIFCAKDSSKKLRLNGYTNVSTEIKKFKKYNFFTSRFYSALDINYEMFNCSPMIIMVTDVILALHSKIDPFTEAIQIPGRFRSPENETLKREIVHISNVDEDLTSMSSEEALNYLNECHIIFRAVDRFYQGASNINAKNTLRQMLERIDYAKYIKFPKGGRNFYMVDHLIFDEAVKGYYQSSNNLIEAYQSCKHFTVGEIKHERYTYTDQDRLKARPKNLPLKELHKILSEKLLELYDNRLQMTDFEFDFEILNLQFDFPDQMIPINKYGIENSYKLKFDTRAIERELDQSKIRKDMFGMLTYIQKSFKVGKAYNSDEMTTILKKGLQMNQIHGIKPSVKYLRKFVELSNSNNRVLIRIDESGKEVRGYKVIKFKDQVV